jgi:hypothetical protein
MTPESISVILPIHKIPRNFDQVRKTIFSVTTPIEIIYVIDKKLNDEIKQENTYEKFLFETNRGRGYMIKKGVHHAQNDITVILHADTLLPPKWDETIIHTMSKKHVIGGAFSLSFINQNTYLSMGILIINLLFNITGVLSGDRAMFVHTKPLKQNLHLLETPIYEDAELSYWMKENGKVIILKDTIKTSSDAFYSRGMIHQTWRILICSLWYFIGRDITKIYRYYYH